MEKIKIKIKGLVKRFLAEDSGSAIILALIIIAGLAGTGIGAARLAKSNTQQASIYEDSLKAFYASEAGIESAMLEWRFDHNVEFWDADQALKCFEDNDEQACEAATVKQVVKLGQVEGVGTVPENISNCFNKDTGEFDAGGSGCGQVGLPRNEAWYEMEISYRNPKYPYLGKVEFDPGSLDRCNLFCDLKETDLVRIAKDESLEISFPVADGVKIANIYWNADLVKTGTTGCGVNLAEECKSRLLVHPVVKDNSGEEVIVPVGQGYLSPDDKYFLDDINNMFIGSDKVYRIDVSSNLKYTGITAIRLKCQSTDNAGGCYVGIEADKGAGESNKLVFMLQKELIMKVTGHYNDVERTLEYKIDRQSGTIMDIFDHGVYSKETLRK